MFPTIRQEFNNTILSWRDDPILFVEMAFQVTPEPWQRKALRAVLDKNRVVIRSGHGVGKTAFLSWVVLWWLLTRHPAKIACTAPTSHQLKDVLWAEIAKWRRVLPLPLREKIVFTGDKIEVKNTDNFAVARTARKEQPEAFQGFHSENMLFIIDEASGVEEAIFEAGLGAMSTEGAKTLMVGNPTRRSGTFFDAFHKARKFWKGIKVSCATSSQVSKKYIKEMAEKYGKESNIFRVRVLGEFPSSEDDAVIPLDMIEAAIHRDVDLLSSADVIWGLDVARFGNDRSALAKRKGNHLLEEIISWTNKDLMQLCGLVKMAYDNAAEADKPTTIAVDVIGLGAGVADRLSEMGLPILAVNVAETPSAADKYRRLRDELWFNARTWFEGRDVVLVDDQALIGELSTPTYDVDSNGKLVVESKIDMRRRGLPSPDLADAFLLTFAATQGRFSKKWQKPLHYDGRWIV
ncbi:MAG: AAA family ATPase [Alphaproteobacteria bacterium]